MESVNQVQPAGEAECTFREGAPYRARRHGLALDFHPAATQADRFAVFHLRQTVYQGRNEYLLRPGEGRHPAEDRFDPDSQLFCCREGEEIVAACRFTPRIAGGWEVGESSALPVFPAVDPDRLLQVSRVVVHPRLRRLQVAEVMMYFSCCWMLQQSRFTAYFAVCLPPLVRFYRPFGVEVLSPQQVSLPGRGENRYFFVHGSFGRSLGSLRQTLRRAAWELPPVPELS